jgi:hypothetical protein
VGVPFCSLGRQNFAAPRPAQFAVGECSQVARFLKISNFSEIEFSFRVPLHYFSS